MTHRPPPVAARPAGHALVEALVAQGIDTVFGVPGESYLAALDGFHAHRERIRFVVCRHEGGASFMAEAQGKLTGRPGVCFVTRGPGASNAAIGLHTAFQDSTPMLLLVGQVASDQRDREAFQEVDYRQMFGPGTLGFAKWVGEVQSADRLPEYVAHAFRVAMQGRPGPVVLALPEDMLSAPTSAAIVPRVEPAESAPTAASLAAIRSELLAAKRPLVIAGGSGWNASACTALQRFAERWRLPAACAFRYQDLFDNHHDRYAGDLGTGTPPALAARVKDADLIVAIGARLGEMTTAGYSLLAAPEPKQRLVHIHTGAEEVGRVYAPDVGIVSSMPAAADALAGIEPPASIAWDAWSEAIRDEAVRNRVSKGVEPMDLAEVVRTIDRHVGADTVFANGAGNATGWLHRFHAYAGLQHAGKTQLAPSAGAMGYGLPAAVASSLLDPSRAAVCFTGDGDFLMTSPEMATAIASGAGKQAPLIAIVVDNASYGTIRMHQEREFPGRVEGSDLVNPDFGALARAFGWHAGDRIDRTGDVEPALVAALAAKRPALLHLKLPTDVITSRTTITAIRAAAAAKEGRT